MFSPSFRNLTNLEFLGLLRFFGDGATFFPFRSELAVVFLDERGFVMGISSLLRPLHQAAAIV